MDASLSALHAAPGVMSTLGIVRAVKNPYASWNNRAWFAQHCYPSPACCTSTVIIRISRWPRGSLYENVLVRNIPRWNGFCPAPEICGIHSGISKPGSWRTRNIPVRGNAGKELNGAALTWKSRTEMTYSFILVDYFCKRGRGSVGFFFFYPATEQQSS
jgi:hypothetical protein